MKNANKSISFVMATGKLDPTFIKWAKSASIGDRLRWLIEYRRITQVALAEKIGQTQASVSNIVTQSSRKPSAPALLKLAAALECSANWLITGEGHPLEVSTVGRKEEQQLLAAFRDMTPQAQNALLAAANAMKK